MSLQIAKYFDCALIGHFDFTQISMEMAGKLGTFIDPKGGYIVASFRKDPNHESVNELGVKILDFFNDGNTVIMLDMECFPDAELKYEIDLTPKK